MKYYVWWIVLVMIVLAACQSTPTQSPVATPVSPLPTATLPATATKEAAQGLIVFHSNRNGEYQVYVMDANGDNVRRLTNFAAPNSEPTWAPDGTKVAFTSGKDDINNFTLYMINADGTEPTRLLEEGHGDNWYPSWSPLGDKVAFQSNFGGSFGIYVVEIGTGQMTKLSNNGATDSMPAWSPDGKEIVFVSDQDGDVEIYTMNADGSERTRLTNSPGGDVHPAWSPDGTKIAFISTRDGDGDIYVMNADGSDPIRLTTSSTSSEWNPTWAAHGTKILFSASYENDWEIYLMNVDGSDMIRLTYESGEDRRPMWLDLD